ncbi:hypothetical protein [Halorubrum sp. 2020YC2]|uniref:hypothetical protein n=1 Tax=Halorubrum sp. 2020YC2 TaxID=2836432 RepID=UPI001BEC6A1B|nr:hypothetical protein [Halorubrum sp. 2020YC2]QWC18398.1 hypothetical protein KI388_09575 [Halorubrum sp. 2020YC2]
MSDEDRPVPEPVRDDVTVELVRDAIGVARGEVPAERFSAKYGTGGESGTPGGDPGTPDRESEGKDGDRE